MPTRLAGLFIDPVFHQKLIRIAEYLQRRIKPDAMFYPVGPLFYFVPLELHGV